MFNCTVSGYVGKDATKKASNGKGAAFISVAVKTGKDTVQWVPCFVYGEAGKATLEYVKSGHFVVVSGSVSITDSGAFVHAYNIQFGPSKVKDSYPSKEESNKGENNDDIPF